MQQRVALVTGGNRGLGLEVCRELAKRGVRAVMGARTLEHGREAAAGLRAEGLEVPVVRIDVADPGSVMAAQQQLAREHGAADILVNNAGVSLDSKLSGGTRFLGAERQALEDTLAVNLYGPWQTCQTFIPGMVARRWGRVVNVSSGMGQLSEMDGGWPAYRISKTALNALTRVVANEVKEDNVLVNAVCPGWVQTDMGGPRAPRTVTQGASGIVWAALLPDGGPTGGFFRDGQKIAW